MDAMLAGLQWSTCLVYIDDIIIPDKTFQAHLREVFDRLRETGLKLKPRKCRLCLQKINFLGHIVSADGIQTDPRKTKKVSTWPTPTSQKGGTEIFLALG